MLLDERIEQSQSLSWDILHSHEIICRVAKRLKAAHFGFFIKDFELLYFENLPLFVQARPAGGPIHHSAVVLELLVQIGLEEEFPRTEAELATLSGDELLWAKKNPHKIGDFDFTILIAAALLHDIGFARVPLGVRRITIGEIRAIQDPYKRERMRQEAVEIRLEHMKYGAKIASEILPRYFSNESFIYAVGRLIGIHDNPTIAELQDEPSEKKKWLFGDPMGPLEKQLLTWVPILREADRLWMLTADGIIADLARSSKEKRRTAAEQLVHNAQRHVEEGQLYREVFPDCCERFGIAEGDPFYRTNTGKRYFRALPAETIREFEA